MTIEKTELTAWEELEMFDFKNPSIPMGRSKATVTRVVPCKAKLRSDGEMDDASIVIQVRFDAVGEAPFAHTQPETGFAKDCIRIRKGQAGTYESGEAYCEGWGWKALKDGLVSQFVGTKFEKETQSMGLRELCTFIIGKQVDIWLARYKGYLNAYFTEDEYFKRGLGLEKDADGNWVDPNAQKASEADEVFAEAEQLF